MQDDFDDYEEKMAGFEKANEELLSGFINHEILKRKQGKRKTHERADQIRFFANEYLANYDQLTLIDGLESVDSFVGDWFIRKCMWSDPASVRSNIEAFKIFSQFLMETNHIDDERCKGLLAMIQENQEEWVLRAKRYNDPDLEPEDLFDEYGIWKDVPTSPREPVVIPGTGTLTLKILLSGKIAKLLKFKTGELAKVKDWGNPENHWSSYWRVEDCCGIKGSRKRIVLVSNERTRYSILLTCSPGKVEEFMKSLFEGLMWTLDSHKIPRPDRVDLNLQFLTGAARSLSSFQNNQLHYVDGLFERFKPDTLVDLEPELNRYVTLTLDEAYPGKAFASECQNDPPFGTQSDTANIISFPN